MAPLIADDCYRMIAVMIMNVGYFLSVLTGVLVGELVLGRHALSVEH